MRIQSFVLVLAACAAPIARADYLIDPSGATELTSSFPQVDDSVLDRSFGGDFDFFGEVKSSGNVSTNGNINFLTTDANFNDDGGLGRSRPVIAPYFDDLYIVPGSSILETVAPGLYAVTWDALGTFDNLTNKDSFQVALFSAPRLVGAFQFQAGDIAFSYAGIGPSPKNGGADLGLDKGDISTFASPYAGGYLPQAGIPTLPNGEQFFLFRPNRTGSYDVSVQTTQPVPEPAVFAALSLGLLPLLRRRQRG